MKILNNRQVKSLGTAERGTGISSPTKSRRLVGKARLYRFTSIEHTCGGEGAGARL